MPSPFDFLSMLTSLTGRFSELLSVEARGFGRPSCPDMTRILPRRHCFPHKHVPFPVALLRSRRNGSARFGAERRPTFRADPRRSALTWLLAGQFPRNVHLGVVQSIRGSEAPANPRRGLERVARRGQAGRLLSRFFDCAAADGGGRPGINRFVAIGTIRMRRTPLSGLPARQAALGRCMRGRSARYRDSSGFFDRPRNSTAPFHCFHWKSPRIPGGYPRARFMVRKPLLSPAHPLLLQRVCCVAFPTPHPGAGITIRRRADYPLKSIVGQRYLFISELATLVIAALKINVFRVSSWLSDSQ